MNNTRLFSAPPDSFLIQQYSGTTKCITYNRSKHLTLAKCISNDPSQKWIWTRHNEILHVKTLKCIQHGLPYRGDDSKLYMDLYLKKCNISERAQEWECDDFFLKKQGMFFYEGVQPGIMRITYTKDIIVQENSAMRWKRQGIKGKSICSSCTFP